MNERARILAAHGVTEDEIAALEASGGYGRAHTAARRLERDFRRPFGELRLEPVPFGAQTGADPLDHPRWDETLGRIRAYHDEPRRPEVNRDLRGHNPDQGNADQ